MATHRQRQHDPDDDGVGPRIYSIDSYRNEQQLKDYERRRRAAELHDLAPPPPKVIIKVRTWRMQISLRITRFAAWLNRLAWRLRPKVRRNG